MEQYKPKDRLSYAKRASKEKDVIIYLDEQRYILMAQLYKSGSTLQEICFLTDLTQTRVRQICRKYGNVNFKESQEQKKKLIVDELKEKYNDVINGIGIDFETISKEDYRKLKHYLNLYTKENRIKNKSKIALKMFKEGISPFEIKKEINTCLKSVYMYLKLSGAKMSLTKEEKKFRDESIKEDHQKGLTTKELQDKYDLTYETIRAVLTNYRQKVTKERYQINKKYGSEYARKIKKTIK